MGDRAGKEVREDAGKNSFALEGFDDVVECAAEVLESAVDGRKGSDVEEAISFILGRV